MATNLWGHSCKKLYPFISQQRRLGKVLGFSKQSAALEL